MKKCYNKLLCALAVAVCALTPTLADAANVTGVIKSAADNQPLIGATVVVEGGTQGVATDVDGKFTLNNVPSEGNLVFTYLGLQSQTHPIENGKNYNISLEADTQAIEEVLVVGYGTMRKVEVSGSVARVEAEALTKVNTSDVGTALQGQVAGVNVQMSSGQPGDVANVQIRGISSITGSNSPLYVVDGIPQEGDPGLSPNEIESLDVLKDAASAAIYGTRGSGGVILITTKGGKEGKLQVAVDANYGVQKITSRLYLTDAAQTFAKTVMSTDITTQQASNNIWTNAKTNQTHYADNSDMASIIEQDLQPIVNANITLSGGNKGATYSVVGNYFNQEGVIINSGYERFNVRANTAFETGRWKLNANLSSKISEKTTPASNLYRQVYSYAPTSPTFDPNTELGTTPGDDAAEKTTMGTILALFKEQNTTDLKSFDANFSATLDITKRLSFTSRFGTSYGINMYEQLKPLFQIYDEDGELVPNSNTRSSYTRRTIENTSSIWENMLNYNQTFGKHDIKATAVFSMEEYNRDAYQVQRYDLISNNVNTFETMTGETTASTGNTTLRNTTLVGMLGRVQYDYDDRYLLSASIRRDASSRFGKENRWGSFPSVSAGWNVSQEDFFSNALNVVNMMKIRASYGTTGNQNFDDYIYSTYITSGLDYAFGTADGSTAIDYGMIQTAFANSNIKWETTAQFNVGVDMTFLDSRLSVTADAYQTTKRDMLLPLSVPSSTGAGTNGEVTVNVGDMENKGVELAIGWREQLSNISYNANFTASRNINTVLQMSGDNKIMGLGELNPGANSDYVTYLVENQEAGAFMLYETDGIVNTEEELLEYSKLVGTADLGDLRYVDQDGDGAITENDRKYMGSGAPEVELGLNLGLIWKNFDVSMIWYASLGNEVINGSKCAAYQKNRHLDILSAWTPWNINSPIPTISAQGHNNYKPSTDYWLEDGSYCRLNNVSLGYSIPKHLISKANISKLRVYVAADNIWTITSYAGYNPGVGNDGLSQRGIDNGTYPISAQIRGGVQVSF